MENGPCSDESILHIVAKIGVMMKDAGITEAAHYDEHQARHHRFSFFVVALYNLPK